MAGDFPLELPNSSVSRILKASLPKDQQVAKKAKIMVNQAAVVFALFTASTAADVSRAGKRKTITADDVVTAMGEMGFPEFQDEINSFLQGMF